MGCQEPPPIVYGPDDPGPWSLVMEEAPEVVFDGNKVTVKVAYESRLGDYVNRIYLTDDRGDVVGNVAFSPGVEPEVTFTDLPTGTKAITVHVVSSQRGRWQGQPIPVPSD
jgi:hypothetical protein